MSSTRLLLSPLVFCGIAVTNLVIVAAVAMIRRDDGRVRGILAPVAALSAAVVCRAVMRASTSEDVVMLMGRMSYMAALVCVPALLAAVTPESGSRRGVLLTAAVAAMVWVDPLVFDGSIARWADLHGGSVLVPALTPWSWWLAPYGLLTSVAIARGAKDSADDDSTWFTAIVAAAVVMGASSVVIVSADLGIVPHTGLEFVAVAGACTLLTQHVLVRSSWQVEELIAATERLEGQRLACSDHRRRIARMSALGDAAGQLVARIEAPARRLDDAVAVARGDIARARDVGDCDAEACQAIVDAGAATRKLLRTIHRVRAFASPEAATSERTDVGSSLRRAIAMLDHMARHQTLIRLTTGDDASVVASSEQLTDLFVGLLRSMMRAASAGTSPHPLTVQMHRRRERVIITITAVTNVAMRWPALDPYGDPNAIDDGHGLEMATSERLVAALGGELRIHETKLTVELPQAGGGR